MRLARRAVQYGRGILGFRAEDVLLASFPRSGSTWLRFVLANLVSLRELDGAEVDFPRLNAMMPELGVSDLLARWPYSTIPRTIKTHRRYSALLRMPRRRVLLVRDPRDVMVSTYLYIRGKTRPRFVDEFGAFLRLPGLGLEAWFRHLRSWSASATLELRYEELRAAELEEVTRLLDHMEVEAQPELIAEALRRSKLGRVRHLEEVSGTGHEGRFQEGFRFARQGTAGGWREWFSSADLDFYACLRSRYGVASYPPE